MICLPCLFVPPIGFICIFTHLLTCPCMSTACLLVCCPYFNTMKLWTFDPNLNLSLMNTTFCFFSFSFAFSPVCLLSCYACHVYHAHLFLCLFMNYLHLFIPLLVCWFLVSAFARKHMERGRMELGHGFPGASKKDTNACMWLSQVAIVSRFRSLASPLWLYTLFKPPSFLPIFSLRWFVLGISCHVPFVLISRDVGIYFLRLCACTVHDVCICIPTYPFWCDCHNSCHLRPSYA